MELKVFKDTLAAAGGGYDAKAELPVETEILIPDLCPWWYCKSRFSTGE